MMFKMMLISGLVLMMVMMMVASQTCQEENRAGVQLFEAGLPPDGRLPPFHHNVEDNVDDNVDDRMMMTVPGMNENIRPDPQCSSNRPQQDWGLQLSS